MAVVPRGLRHESDVLIRQIEGRLATLRMAADAAGDTAGLALAERVAEVLRRLVAETARASAADRARARAAVHAFVVRRPRRRHRGPGGSVNADVQVVNQIVRDLGRDDLAIAA
jgi:hypothetical protein